MESLDSIKKYTAAYTVNDTGFGILQVSMSTARYRHLSTKKGEVDMMNILIRPKERGQLTTEWLFIEIFIPNDEHKDCYFYENVWKEWSSLALVPELPTWEFGVDFCGSNFGIWLTDGVDILVVLGDLVGWVARPSPLAAIYEVNGERNEDEDEG